MTPTPDEMILLADLRPGDTYTVPPQPFGEQYDRTYTVLERYPYGTLVVLCNGLQSIVAGGSILRSSVRFSESRGKGES